MIDIPEIKRTSRVIRAGRKLRGFTQVELAKKISVAQSTISKYESGILLPDVSFWFHFCKLVGIEAQSSFESGTISKQLDNYIPLEQKSSSFRIPEIFKPTKHAIQMRSINPILEALKELTSEEEVSFFVDSLKIDTDIFFVQDFLLSLHFVKNILQQFREKIDLEELLKKAVINYSHSITCHQGQSISEVISYFSSLDNLFINQVSPLQSDYQKVLINYIPELEISHQNPEDEWFKEYKLSCFAEYLRHNKKTKAERNKAEFQITIIQ